MSKKKTSEDVKRCWEFLRCRLEEQKECLLSETHEWRCWQLNIACCKMHRETPRPLSVKKTACLTCSYYLEYRDASRT